MMKTTDFPRCLFTLPMRLLIKCLLLVLCCPAIQAAENDVLIADFEGQSYGDWKAEGEAFGPGPARGTLRGQMTVSGFVGKGLVNTFFNGDPTTGTLTSPPIVVERDFLTFLIGGGGHVNVDQIVLSDEKPKVPVRVGLLTKELVLDKKFILFPIRTGAKTVRVDLQIDGQNVREFDAEIATSPDDVSFWSFLDVTGFAGKTATLKVNGATEPGFALIAASDEVPGADDFYDEPLRPQFHFSQQVGWNNDPNGMVYYDGEWHLYFQHNPYGWKWGNMHWGHAISKDLVHWEQLPIAIYNKRRGDWAFSGGAVVDQHNTADWQTGQEKVIVASWTSTGRGECLAYSNDRGRTFVEYEGNPVIKHGGRDPKIVWYEPGQHWVLAVYDESKEAGRAIAFFTSKDMKQWELQSKLPGYFECPELFELPVDGDQDNTRWVVFAADARYAFGNFDGKTFTPEHEGKHLLHDGAYYASQTFSNAPDGRRIQIGWARIAMPGMPFNQTFSFPHELTLRTTDDGIRMFAEPVAEIETLHKRQHAVDSAKLSPESSVAVDAAGELFDIRATFELGDAAAVGLDVGGQRITYDARANTLNGAPLKPIHGRVSVQVLVDRPMLEICGNHGRVCITSPRGKKGEESTVKAFATGGNAKLLVIEVNELESIWTK